MRSGQVLKVLGFGASLAAAVLLGACATTNLGSNKIGWSDYATIAIKDYAIVGIVRVTSEETNERSVFGIVTSHKGSQITYDMLIQEAKALGADDIINVRVDRVDESSHIPMLEWLIGYTERCSYIGTALAITYKDAQPGFRRANQDRSPGLRPE